MTTFLTPSLLAQQRPNYNGYPPLFDTTILCIIPIGSNIYLISVNMYRLFFLSDMRGGSDGQGKDKEWHQGAMDQNVSVFRGTSFLNNSFLSGAPRRKN